MIFESQTGWSAGGDGLKEMRTTLPLKGRHGARKRCESQSKTWKTYISFQGLIVPRFLHLYRNTPASLPLVASSDDYPDRAA